MDLTFSEKWYRFPSSPFIEKKEAGVKNTKIFEVLVREFAEEQALDSEGVEARLRHHAQRAKASGAPNFMEKVPRVVREASSEEYEKYSNLTHPTRVFEFPWSGTPTRYVCVQRLKSGPDGVERRHLFICTEEWLRPEEWVE